eukprot:CAMPEP_0176305770 /NCGR_PEP_ID=MMETSP0121_2-20121125/63132_1 /TAXON_ID=160619 /ORGANISM="Kryptoperidinium foliaceum, Strain CCMP 1326" /LENGTH=97 /DNA_ID=CAMNT_0017647447 /DNA_START=85 /DNA_END=374 /DNA_ORIENTATION=-
MASYQSQWNVQQAWGYQQGAGPWGCQPAPQPTMINCAYFDDSDSDSDEEPQQTTAPQADKGLKLAEGQPGEVARAMSEPAVEPPPTAQSSGASSGAS